MKIKVLQIKLQINQLIREFFFYSASIQMHIQGAIYSDDISNYSSVYMIDDNVCR